MPTTQTLSIETITPDQAKKLLELNINNRVLRPSRIAIYAAMMSRGEWRLTGEPIILNGTTLVNGQHRLAACVQADVPFTTAVFRGAGEDVYAVIDSGLGRTASDGLRHDNHAKFTVTAAAARLVLGFDNGVLHDPFAISQVATRPVILDEADRHRERYATASTMAAAAHREAGFNPSAMTAFIVLLGRHIGDDAADEWVPPLWTGVDLEGGDPRLAMRRWVIRGQRSNVVQLSALIRTRNAFYRNESRVIIKPWFRGSLFPTFDEPARF